MAYKKIGDYGIIGNLRTVALVALDGSIDWLCLPSIDSPSIFAALLDDNKGGRFSITPAGEFSSTAAYVQGTNILETTFTTETGTMILTDFMPVAEEAAARAEVYRCARVTGGEVTLEVAFKPSFDYARAETRVQALSGGFVASAGGESIRLSSTVELGCYGRCATASVRLEEGDTACFILSAGTEAVEGDIAARLFSNMEEVRRFWQGWLEISETGVVVEPGPWKEMVERSALALKLISFAPTGAIAAAATTSLPEDIGGVRNWDYRFTWIRDTSFILQALFNLGHMQETEEYLRWLQELLSEHGAGGMQIMYGLRGESDIAEVELDHLEGYRGSSPVRVGNEAYKQRQLDIYGELMDAALKLSNYIGRIDTGMWPFFRDVCDYVVGNWKEKDAGIWEVRGGDQHFVYSKLMCWVALDRGEAIARKYGFRADLERWGAEREAIREAILTEGWNERRGSFVSTLGGDTLDASALMIPLVGFLPFSDERVVSTIDAVQAELCRDRLLYRYLEPDGLPGGEGAFLFCTFWLIDCLIGLGRLDEATEYLEHMSGCSNHLGLFSEEFDNETGELLGNFPQAFTHIGFINSAMALRKARITTGPERPSAKWSLLSFLEKKVVLNDDIPPPPGLSPETVVGELKAAMNTLRGGYFDTSRGRVAYELMAGSAPYKRYKCLSGALKMIDPASMAGDDERLAFWINIYNLLVIHSVVELGVKDSVKEVHGFFSKSLYRIGGFVFSLDDIEHGILRGNKRSPTSLWRPFSASDKRLGLKMEHVDPRIHFALVCASSSCPPIELYTPGGIDRELTLAGEVFINSGGMVTDRNGFTLSLSKIFYWYGSDFADDLPALLRYLARFLYDPDDAAFVTENADKLRVDYQDYDWRLNRT